MSVLNERLKKWSCENDIITDAQFGFKSNHSTVDAIFLLNTFIQQQLNDRKKLYCCFVDFQKCFDTIYRNGLWYKLIKCNLNGKIFSVIRSMYEDIKLCVKTFNNISDFFSSDIGLLQGEISSPILFALFMNDIETFLQNDTSTSFTIEELNIYLLLFADDSVLISETAEELQNLLNSFEKYCEKWKLKVNIEKTKVMVFRKGGKLNKKDILSSLQTFL